ncbi:MULTISPECIES: hypothetical protein [unclassified Microcoleus]|uniref:hypothetical protein n=1 Tax=unclassified Microcoleus TaxID=2642155 RepID=UPI002FD3CF91
MSNTQNNPNSGQTVPDPSQTPQNPGQTPQNPGQTPPSSKWRKKLKVAAKQAKNLMFRTALFGGVVKTIEFFVNISQVPQAICILTPYCQPPLPPPGWIATRIEDVYIKKLNNYEIDTTLVVTDKPPDKQPEYEVSIIRNVDQNLSRIGRPSKQNSGQYEAFIRKAKNNRTPLCLEIYGRRNFKTSEFKNIIGIKEFPSNNNYDSLTPEQRNQLCEPPRLL